MAESNPIKKLPRGAVRTSRRKNAGAGARWNPALRWINLAVSYTVLVFLAGPSSHEIPFVYVRDAPLRQSIVAPFDLRIVDFEAQRARISALQREQHFLYDIETRDRGIETLERILELAKAAREAAPPDAKAESGAEWAALIKALGEIGVAEPETHAALLAEQAEWGKFSADLLRSLKTLYDSRGVVSPVDLAKFRLAEREGTARWVNSNLVRARGITIETLLDRPAGVRAYLRNSLLRDLFNFRTRQAAEELLMAIVEPVVVFDAETKERNLRAAEENPITKFYAKDSVIFRQGRQIGEAEEETLEAFRDRYRRYQVYAVLGVALFVAILFALIILYARRFPGEVPFTASDVALISLPAIISFAIWRYLSFMGVGEHVTALLAHSASAETLERFSAAEMLSGFGFPAGLIGMLGVALYGPRLGWLLVLCGGLLFGVSAKFNFGYAIVALVGGFAAVSSLYSAQSRRDIMAGGLKVGGANALMILAVLYMQDPARPWMTTAFAAGCGMINGLACGALTLPLLWFFERHFAVVTDFALLELTGLDHPLMQELEEKAPGTYQHTLNVTKLAESAAKAVGANYLLVRAGGYFHDIGKIVKPHYFSENQLTREDRNLHSKLKPVMSALIIKNHVKEGMELARKYGLPPEVAAFIPEHHGTAMVSFLYNMAKEQFQNSESPDAVREEDFRYPGPKPQTAETAIIMLADTAEATMTSIFSGASVSEDQLRREVLRSINTKFSDGQLDECDLTLRDLHDIGETFVQTLIGRFHFRVPYPDKNKPTETSKVAAPTATATSAAAKRPPTAKPKPKTEGEQ